MWPNMPLDYVKLPKDKNGIHYGLFVDSELIAVLSLFIIPDQKTAQFRKFATLKNYQGKGYGSQLLNYVIGEAKNQKITKIWCNARIEKIAFYKKFGLQETKHTFVKNNMSYVIMEKPFLTQ